MKFVARPQQTSVPLREELSPGNFDVLELLAKSGEILRREVLNLMSASSRGKLSKADATDLVAYIRLLNELKDKQEEVLKELTTEELEQLVK